MKNKLQRFIDTHYSDIHRELYVVIARGDDFYTRSLTLAR